MVLDQSNLLSSDKYLENYRPQFHFTPESNWMNDPNGMVYYEGEYHLFYQYHPYSTVWGPMHWGHAVSMDLIHWEHLPIALYPDKNGAIFSGSAVVDWKDSSGFFNGGTGLVAIFTSADGPVQTQSIAYSTDKGRTWKIYEGNPVLIEESCPDFRDPKVFWHEELNKWIMILAVGDHVRIYLSDDFKSWDFASEFGREAGSHEGVWECPDLFELPIGETNIKKWVMLVSIGNDDAHPEGSRTQYFIGEFDGKTFVNDNPDDTVLWVDYGRDNYAGVTWSDTLEERRVFIGWMSNWKYANITPTKEWRSAMTLPRELSLISTLEGIRLAQTPVKEIENIRKEKREWKDLIIHPNSENILSDCTGKEIEILAEFELDSATEFGFEVRASNEEKTLIGYDATKQELFIDREHSGESSFHPLFACRHTARLQPVGNRVSLRLFVDWSSVEVFANSGETVMTDLIFPSSTSEGVALFAIGGDVKLISLEIYHLNTIWK
ncbi:glycoside hydrolase family 32 protein [Neobacillus cucumis]|uniref:glycoside hydrolase family 32 protein n=1 Tax=Neobacillus cucumis TaxID=1740721 RepID=UPI002E201764|nr:glycoside hydrolase family 32 protein [Neobacillus cucumis]